MFRSMNSLEMLLPVALLAIEDDEDRQLLTELYHTYKRLFYRVAARWFGQDHAEIEDAIATALEHTCRYIDRIKKVPPPKRPFYMRRIIENVCRRRSVRRQSDWAHCRSLDADPELQLAAEDDVFVSAFDQVVVKDLLEAYSCISERDRNLIWMRHVEGMEFREIAEELQIREGTARTALSRARRRLQQEALKKRRDS